MSLPAAEIEHLIERAKEYAISSEASMTCVVLRHFPIPRGYAQTEADLLLRLSPGYPDVPPDMWWFDPPLRRADGGGIPATEHMETHLGRQWQRWSRHFNPGQWQSGRDSLETFLALIRKELEKYAAPTQ